MEILRYKLDDLNIIHYTIVSKHNGYKGPGAFVFKNGDKALFAGYSNDISKRLIDEDFENFIVEGDASTGPRIRYTQIDIYLTANNYIAARVAYILMENLRPLYNQEVFIESELPVDTICEEYFNASSTDKYALRIKLKQYLSEEEYMPSRQLSIEEAWEGTVEFRPDLEDKK